MAVTYYSSNLTLDRWFGQVTLTPPANYYFGLSTSTPSVDGSSVTEPSGGSYARVLLANNKTNWSTASNGILTNLTAVTFPESTASWGTVTNCVLYDAPTGGNLLWYDVLSPARTIASATTVLFAIGAISVQFNNT